MVSKDSVKCEIDSVAALLKEASLEIHDHPEVGLHEEFACKTLTDILKKFDFDVTTGTCGFPTAFIATYRGKEKGPVIAFMCEYDALPGLGHGCGHNLICTASVGAGIASRALVDAFGGEIRVYGTPAEENFGTKVRMVETGEFDGVDVAMMGHPGYADVDNLNSIADKAIVVEFFGRSTHAACSPEMGINALDAAISMFNMINALRQQTKDGTRIHGIIEDGGKAPNVIPDYTRSAICIRSGDTDYCYELFGKIEAIIESAAKGTGCTFRISDHHLFFKGTRQNLFLSELAARNIESFGSNVIRAKGIKVQGSSDFGNVSQACPALQFAFNIGVPGSGNVNGVHTVEMVRDSASDVALDAMVRASKVLAMTAFDLLSDAGNLQKVRSEFESNRAGRQCSAADRCLIRILTSFPMRVQ